MIDRLGVRQTSGHKRSESLDSGALPPQQSGFTEGGTPDLCFLPCGSRSDAPWYCLQTHPGAELEAEWRLRDQGFAAYLPLFESLRQNRQSRIAPLFPGYLFAQITDQAPSWGPMRSTRGVSAVLVTPGTAEPAGVDRAILIGLWLQCAPNGVIYQLKPKRRAANLVGKAVEVTVGPFASFIGICERSARDRVAVLLSIFGRNTTVWLRPSEVRLAG